MSKIVWPFLWHLYVHLNHAKQVSFDHTFKDLIFGYLSFVILKESWTHGIDEGVDLWMLTTVVSKLALPHFYDMMFAFQIFGDFLGLFVLLDSHC